MIRHGDPEHEGSRHFKESRMEIKPERKSVLD